MTTTPTHPPPPQYAPAKLGSGLLLRKVRKDKGRHKHLKLTRAMLASVRAWRKEWVR